MSHAAHAAPALPHDESEGSRHVLPEQQPLGQLAAQVPHVPLAHAPPSQASHERPAAPHDVAWLPDRHVVPLQQPAHDSASQTHAPLRQRCPLPQAGPTPHAQAPVGEQRSERASQAAHATPEAPHAPVDGVRHVVPEQQPPGQLDASQTQAPFTQLWPAPQAGPFPQRHMPDAHALLFAASQVMHALRGKPQAVGSGVRHEAPAQQPPGQVAAHDEHAPAEHVSPAGHAAQVEPALPHDEGSSPDLHWSPWQQPVGQLAGVHRHEPSTHCWPGLQAPAVPHVQTPSVQLLVFDDGQTTQAAPALPHVVNDWGRHTSPAQQPSAHDAAVQAHRPFTHSRP